MRTRAIASLLTVSAMLRAGGVATASDDAGVAAKTYANCTALNRVYAHGVGKWGAKDKTSGTKVTTFKRSNDLYRANKGSDGDGDGIACEKA